MRAKLTILFLAAPAIAGCSAVTSTTNTTARTLDAGLKATTQSSEATTNGESSPEYADARRFVDSQFAMIRREAATGGGEHTAALARLMGTSDTAAFDAWLQSNYAVLFNNLSQRTELVTRIAARRGQATTIGRNNDA